jgi:CheY-like chemotaxis protein
MDCEMPILDGWETTKLLYKLKENNEIKHLPPIIGATAYSDNESIKKCLLVGMNDVVPKPCPKDDLFRKVRHWILKDKDQI